MKNIKRFYPELLAVLGFVLVSLFYFYPVLKGNKAFFQSDIAQYTGMAKEQNDFRKAHDEEPYWTNNAFGGMPTYQMGANYPHNYIKKIDAAIRFLPRPADYLFLYFLGFFILLRVLKIDPLKAFFGALAFGFSTYMVIILGAGHNAKAHTIAYMPVVIAGIILVFRKRYIVGGLVTLLATALEINANHFQMTYYLLFLLLCIGIYYIVDVAKTKDYKHLGTSIGVFVVAGIVALGLNATSLMATSEFTNYSIRGKSELTFKADGTPVTSGAAMDYNYITEYSYGIGESLNLLVPRLYGGGSHETVKGENKVYEYFINLGLPVDQAKQISENVPYYWGDQPIVEAPAYIGIVVFFLAVFALFADNRKIKYAFLAGAILTLLLSWGKNLSGLTNFFIENVPMYDKFRAVSSIQVILELCIPVLAFMGLQTFFKLTKEEQFKNLWKSTAVVGGLLVVLFILKGSFAFEKADDEGFAINYILGPEAFQKYGAGYIQALKEARMDMFTADITRALFFVLAAAAALFFAYKQKLSETVAVIIVGVLAVGDLFTVDHKYVNADDFVSESKMTVPFEPNGADEFILKDDGHFRVYEPGARMQGRTSYFHQSVGGYSAVRPRRMDELFTFTLESGKKDAAAPIYNNIDEQTLTLKSAVPVLDLLNVKYLILQGQQGDYIPLTNPFAAGPAWFVSTVKPVTTADDEFKSVEKLDVKNVAVVNKEKFPEAAAKTTFVKDSTATIKLESYEPNHLRYTTNNSHDGFAVFSEMYYPKGWNATIDGKPATHYQADYTLRAMPIPAGKHSVEFKFEPQVVKTGSTITLISFVLFLGLLGGGIWFENKKSKQPAQA
ncbi:YfhO family protein [Flavobacterium sp. RHBU_3]|uniref:YfhO family protein n=1 Tax=Flavobacterium sp. RHBU_3 TaxID=3391184 RepID=UPI0039852969